MNSKFVLHHVGARNGSRGFPIVKKFEKDIVTIFYEACEDGNDQIISQAKRNGAGETLLINACIGSKSQIQNFYINRDPFMSSVYPANQDYSDFYNDLKIYDNLMSQILEPVEVSKIQVSSLDEIILKRELPSCDFLSIDVQGGELDVLKGANDSLINTSGVLLEVEFAEMYEGQPLFGEVDEFLKSNGFKFIRFLGFQEWAPRTVSIEGRGRKLHVAADALYLKDWSLVKKSNIDRLVFSALSFGQTEFALKVIQQQNYLNLEGSDTSWREFVRSFIKLTTDLHNLPPTFSDVYSVDESFGRFNESYSALAHENLVIEGIFNLWRLLPVALRSKIKRSLGTARDTVAMFKRLMSRRSKLERLFSDSGLKAIANELRKSRLRR